MKRKGILFACTAKKRDLIEVVNGEIPLCAGKWNESVKGPDYVPRGIGSMAKKKECDHPIHAVRTDPRTGERRCGNCGARLDAGKK